VMVGTRKGLFLFWSADGRRLWHHSHHHPSWEVFATAYDGRDGTLYATTNSPVWGAMVARTGNFGASWQSTGRGLDFAADGEFRVSNVWQLEVGPGTGEIYAGTERAGLFSSSDHGETWQPVRGIGNHPHAASWMPGKGGLCLHTILRHPRKPDRMWVAISTGGCYRTDDGGESWHPANKGVAAPFLPDPYPEYGQCVHKIAHHPQRPDVLYLQNHGGVYRSDDGGDTWLDIAGGLPSDFGFPIVVHPHDPATVYVVPLNSDLERYTTGGHMAVWRTRDRGASWEPLDRGLPDEAYLVILRDAMAADSFDETGLYVGTNTGQLFFSRDEGQTWGVLSDMLPPICCVSAVRIAEH